MKSGRGNRLSRIRWVWGRDPALWEDKGELDSGKSTAQFKHIQGQCPRYPMCQTAVGTENLGQQAGQELKVDRRGGITGEWLAWEGMQVGKVS